MPAYIDFLVHFDRYLDQILAQYGDLTYALLFLIIFAETGLVATPFLPGDSLLFVAGTFAARGSLDPFVLAAVLIVAAVLGDTANYWIGYHVGPRVFRQDKARFFKKEYLERTAAFYDKYGQLTIVLARFVPIIRTFAPFVAGIGRMQYARFLLYNVLGGLLWVILFVFGGYFFGNIPWVKQNYSLVIILIIIVSFLPTLAEIVRQRRRGG